MKTIIQVPDTICEIAVLIRSDWKIIYFGAKPYVEAMLRLNHISDNYYEDSGAEIVAYFLGNAQTWQGEVARAVKAKLNALLKTV